MLPLRACDRRCLPQVGCQPGVSSRVLHPSELATSCRGPLPCAAVNLPRTCYRHDVGALKRLQQEAFEALVEVRGRLAALEASGRGGAAADPTAGAPRSAKRCSVTRPSLLRSHMAVPHLRAMFGESLAVAHCKWNQQPSDHKHACVDVPSWSILGPQICPWAKSLFDLVCTSMALARLTVSTKDA